MQAVPAIRGTVNFRSWHASFLPTSPSHSRSLQNACCRNDFLEIRTEKTRLSWPVMETNLHCCLSTGCWNHTPPSVSRPRGPRLSFTVSRHQMTPMICKGFPMATHLCSLQSSPPWSPLFLVALGGLREAQRSWDSPCKVIQPRRTGWWGNPTKKRVCEQLFRTQWPLRNLFQGKTEDLYWQGLRKKCLSSFRTCPRRLQAKNVQRGVS